MKSFMKIYCRGIHPWLVSTGISKSQIARWSYSNTLPNPKNLYRLCFILSCYHNLPSGDIMLDAVRSIRGLPCKNLLIRKTDGYEC